MRTGKPDNTNGYTTIANELLEILALYPFTRCEYKVLLVIIRRTYGWKLKKNKLSYGIIANACGISRRQVKRTIDKLVRDNILIRESSYTGSVFGLNKYYLGWRLWKTSSPMDTDVHRVLFGVSTVNAKNVHTSMDTGAHSLASGERKERNIYKENSKERNCFSRFFSLKTNDQGFREHPKQPVAIKEVIRSIT